MIFSAHHIAGTRAWLRKWIPLLVLAYFVLDTLKIAKHELTLKRAPLVSLHAPDSGWRDIQFSTADHLNLAGWYSPTTNGQTIVILHGHAGNRSQVLPVANLLRSEGFGVFLYDTRAHGASEGAAIGYGATELFDIQAALDWLEARAEVDTQRIGVYGFSLGGYFAVREAVSDRRISALVLAGTPSSLLELSRDEAGGGIKGMTSSSIRFLANRLAGRKKFEHTALESVRALTGTPLLLLSGGLDALVPPDRAWEVYAAAGFPKTIALFPEAGHGNYLEAEPQRFHRLVVDFFRSNLTPRNTLSGR